MTDLVPQAVRDLLAFYSERYPEVRFGDLDLSMLKRAVESIDEAASAVIAAEEAVAQARQQFRAIEGEITQKANRTLSFLKIFVDGDEEQLAALEAISLAMPASRRKSKAAPADATGAPSEPRQRRPRKSKNADDSATQSADAAIDAALSKAGLTDDELTELGADDVEADESSATKEVAAE